MEGGWSEDRWKWGDLGLTATIVNNSNSFDDFLFVFKREIRGIW